MLTIGKKVGRGGTNVANDVMLVQVLLNMNIKKMPGQKPIKMDGKSGKNTESAISKFQELVVKMRMPDARVDPGGKTISTLVRGASAGAPPNMTAVFERTRFEGQNRQMKIGRISVNGVTYLFTCGGFGRGSIPTGEYEVSKHLDTRSESSFSVDGVGYSFKLSDKWDARALKPGTTTRGDTRSLLRIHPDGGKSGTNGCIGILGGGQTQKSFRTNMNAEIKKANKTAKLKIK